MTNPVSSLRAHMRLLLGSNAARRSYRDSLELHADRTRGVKHFFELAPPPDTGAETVENAPIFLFSAGWRSGSTLLQRLISSGEGILIWGEAYHRSAIVQNMVDGLAPFSDSWPPQKYMETPPGDISEIWAANLFPPPEALRDAYRDMLVTLFAEPVRALGATRWGFKEVRFGHAEALLLKGLFPEARFLFIRRRLEDAYLSYSRFSAAMDWYGRWPEETAFTPYDFARHWARLSDEFDHAVAATDGILVEYEDLVSGKVDFDRLGSYIGTPVNRAVLERRVGSGSETGREKSVTGFERLLLKAGRRAGHRRG